MSEIVQHPRSRIGMAHLARGALRRAVGLVAPHGNWRLRVSAMGLTFDGPVGLFGLAGRTGLSALGMDVERWSFVDAPDSGRGSGPRGMLLLPARPAGADAVGSAVRTAAARPTDFCVIDLTPLIRGGLHGPALLAAIDETVAAALAGREEIDRDVSFRMPLVLGIPDDAPRRVLDDAMVDALRRRLDGFAVLPPSEAAADLKRSLATLAAAVRLADGAMPIIHAGAFADPEDLVALIGAGAVLTAVDADAAERRPMLLAAVRRRLTQRIAALSAAASLRDLVGMDLRAAGRAPLGARR